MAAITIRPVSTWRSLFVLTNRKATRITQAPMSAGSKSAGRVRIHLLILWLITLCPSPTYGSPRDRVDLASALALGPAADAVESERTEPFATDSHRWTDIAIATYVAAECADIGTSIRAFDRGWQEGNPLMPGAHRHRAAFLITKAATTAMTAYLLHRTRRSHPKLTRYVAFGLAAVIGGIAIHNAAQMNGAYRPAR